MGTVLGFLKGAAGGVAGLLPLAPWIIAAVIALVGAGGFLWKQHDLDAANAAIVTKQTQIDNLNKSLGEAQTANAADEATIKALQDNDAANDALIEQYQHQADEDARISKDAGDQIRNLQNADASVDAFLKLPIPDALRSLLNHEPTASATVGANQNNGAPATKAK